jgi:very-short-patch-repair endonuclease
MKQSLISRGGCLPYNPDLIVRSRELRKNMTPAEKKLWHNFLRKHNLLFHRQKIINHYILDFYCSKALLALEIDGETHFTTDAMEYDKNRTAILEGYGIKVLRFTNEEVYDHFAKVCSTIDAELASRLEKPPNPL